MGIGYLRSMQTKLPNDGFMGSLPMGPAAEPEFSDSICLQGPCTHLWVMKTSFAHGNPAGTFPPGKEPRKVSRSCTACSSEELDLDGVAVYECSRHRPMTQAELLEKGRRELDLQARTEKEGTK